MMPAGQGFDEWCNFNDIDVLEVPCFRQRGRSTGDSDNDAEEDTEVGGFESG